MSSHGAQENHLIANCRFAYWFAIALVEAALFLAPGGIGSLTAEELILKPAADGDARENEPTGADAAVEEGMPGDESSDSVSDDQSRVTDSFLILESEPAQNTQPIEITMVHESSPEIVIEAPCAPEREVSFGDWLGYNPTRSNMTWLPSDQFGMFSMESFPTLEVGENSAFMVGTGFHFLDGPVDPDMPPRLFDIHAAYHVRKLQSRRLMLDIKVGVGAFSDFEGSARKGIRYPGHAVAYREWNDQCVGVFGVEVLDRDDISLLPVAGLVLRPTDDWVFDVVFPRPKIQWQIDNDHAMYVAGELGGGTWAIERVDASYDNATYRDLRITCGVMDFGDDSHSVLEIGWAFDRELTYRSARGDRTFGGALILRCHAHY